MSVKLAKTSNYTGLDNLWFNLDDYLSNVDTDIRNLFLMANPTMQFGSGSSYSIIIYSGGNAQWTSILGGWNITADLLYSGAGTTYIGLKQGTGIWLGDSTFAVAPFSVDSNGVIKAHSGDIGGWNINATYIKDHSTDNNANILLDSVNGLVRVGPDTGNNYITIDGKNLYMQSSNFVSGPLGQGWRVDSDIAEFQDIRARGMFKTATFEYDVVSALGGNLLIANADILEKDMTSNDNSSLKITSGTHFSVNDILRIKDGVDDEWLKVTSSTTAYTYVVSRDMDIQYGADLNPVWKKGTCVVSYGSDGNGAILMSGNGPNIDVITHTGSPYDYAPTQLRIGNLNGFLGYTTKTYGIAIGNANQYLKYDTANGFRIAGHTLLGSLDISTDGYIASGQTAYNTGTGYWFDYNSGTPRFSIGCDTASNMTWDGHSLRIQTAKSGARLEIFPDTSTGIAIYDDSENSVFRAVTSGTDVGDVIMGSKLDSYTKLISHFDGVDAVTTYTAETGQTVTFVGTAQLDTAQKKFGTASLLLDGDSDFVTVPDSANWNFGAGDFTIDCWVRFNVVGDTILVGQFASESSKWEMLYITGRLIINFVDTTTKGNYNFAWIPEANVWYHLAFERVGTSAKIFVDGVSQILTETVAFSTTDVGIVLSVLYIGVENSNYYFNGWIDEVRISKGIARWTENFTPPTNAYADVDSYAQWDKSAETFIVSNLQSPDYSYTQTGYKLSASDGLEVNIGKIFGRALKSATTFMAGFRGRPDSTWQPPANRVVATHVQIPYELKVARLGFFNDSTITNCQLKMAIYSDAGNGFPGTLLAESDELTTIYDWGENFCTIPETTLNNGEYWFCMLNSTSGFYVGMMGGGIARGWGLTYDKTYGSFETNFGGGTTTSISANPYLAFSAF